jgi:predicted transcriptional regulator YdeE
VRPATGLLMHPIAVATDAFLVVGIKARTTNRIEAVPQTAKIPILWQRFFEEDVAAAIPERLPDPDVIAVYTKYESDHQGPYTLIVGHKVRTLDRIPKGMGGVLVPAARYLRFEAEGPLPQALVDAWKSIWRFFEVSHEYERSYTTDYEVHRKSDVEIYIAVK